MSAFIEILDKGNGLEFNVAIRRQNITLWTYGEDVGGVIGFDFDMSDESHRQAVKNLVEVLQHQLEVHGVE